MEKPAGTRSSSPCYLKKCKLSKYSSRIALNKLSRSIFTEFRLVLFSATTAKTFAVCGPTANNPLNVSGAVVATCTENVLKRQIQYLRRAAAVEHQKKDRTLIQHYIEAEAMRKGNCKTKGHCELSRDPLRGSPLSSPHQSSAMQPHCVKTQHRKQQPPQTIGKSVRYPVQQHLSQQEIQTRSLLVHPPVRLIMTR